MIKVQVLENFSLKAFDELKNIERFNPQKNQKGKLYEKDVFECSEKMCDYLTGNNALNKKVVQIIEIEQPKKEVVANNEEKTKTSKKKTSKK